MSELDVSRIPISELGLDEEELLRKYMELIHAHHFSSAIEQLNLDKCEKGIRASLFNKLKNKMLELEAYLLNLTAEPDVLYSVAEPTAEEMEGKKYWVKPIS